MKNIAKLIFPPRCAACRELLPYDGERGEVVLCRECRGEWEFEKLARCAVCGEPMIDCQCIPDMLRNAGGAGLVRLVEYNPSRREGAVNSIINNLKRIKDKDYFTFFASSLIPPIKRILEKFELDISDTVISFCPRRKSAKRDHGFDQAEELARFISMLSGARFEAFIERRPSFFTRAQKKKSAVERYESSRRSVRLSASGRCEGERIILIDDIITTGATASACTDLLRSAGAELIITACLATSVKRE